MTPSESTPTSHNSDQPGLPTSNHDPLQDQFLPNQPQIFHPESPEVISPGDPLIWADTTTPSGTSPRRSRVDEYRGTTTEYRNPDCFNGPLAHYGETFFDELFEHERDELMQNLLDHPVAEVRE